MINTFLDYYKLNSEHAPFDIISVLSDAQGFFLFGLEIVCYGRNATGAVSPSPEMPLSDVTESIATSNGRYCLPFDVDELVDNLRLERYIDASSGVGQSSFVKSVIKSVYYAIRPLMPVSVRKHLQKIALRGWDKIPFPSWPVDCTVDRFMEALLVMAIRASGEEEIPFIWFWPDGHMACVTMTHDVETTLGRDFCSQLMDIDDSHGIKSAFQVVPEQRYEVTDSFLDEIKRRGFEVNIHGLNHDGRLFRDSEIFKARVGKINDYANKFGARGFRSPVLYRNEQWFDALEFDYEMSVPSVAHLDPQHGGCCTVMPYSIGNILELPLTTTQDYSLFHVMNDYCLDLWKKQIEIIVDHYGSICFNTHPDYLKEKRAIATYQSLLEHISVVRKEHDLWAALPGEINDWWRQRGGMNLCLRDGQWQISGDGCERACVAYASLQDGRVAYRLTPAQAGEGS